MIFVYALIGTLAIVVCGIITKTVRPLWVYVLLYAGLLGSAWLFGGTVHAGGYEQDEWTCRAIINMQYRRAVVPYGIAKDDYPSLIKFHRENGERTLADAKARVFYIPNTTMRRKAEYCFGALFANMAATTPQSKIVYVIGETMVQYGLDCIDEWQYIQDKLHWSNYHFGMAEFYQDVMRGYR